MSAFNLRVSQKLPALIVALCVVSALACGMIAAHSLTKDGIYLATEKLIALRSSRAATLRLYLGTIEQDMSFLARHGYIRQALKDFMAAWKSLENLQTEHLHSLYIEKTPTPSGGNTSLMALTTDQPTIQLISNIIPGSGIFLKRAAITTSFSLLPTAILSTRPSKSATLRPIF